MAILTKKEREALRDAEIERRGTDTECLPSCCKLAMEQDRKRIVKFVPTLQVKVNRLYRDGAMVDEILKYIADCIEGT